MAIENGVPLRISQRGIACAQFIFTLLTVSLILYFTVFTKNEPESFFYEKVGALHLLALFAFPTFVVFSLSDAIMVNGQLRLKTILSKPHYVDPTNISFFWLPFGPKAKILVVFCRTRFLLPKTGIIVVAPWIRYAKNIKLLLEHTQGPACIIRKPELTD